MRSGKKTNKQANEGSFKHICLTRNSQRVELPDVDGCVVQDLAVAVPAAVGGGAATSRMISADLAEDLALAGFPQVQLQVRVALAVTRREAETPNAVDLNERQVKLLRTKQGRRRRKTGVTVSGVDV